jgi:colanic acid biosynthesis protein WcaH
LLPSILLKQSKQVFEHNSDGYHWFLNNQDSFGQTYSRCEMFVIPLESSDGGARLFEAKGLINMFLNEDVFKTVIASTPLVSIDLVVKNPDGEFLLGYRNNRPAQGFWFVPGGRILKDESMDAAFLRLTKNELGFEISRQSADFLGPYEHFYSDCVFGAEHSTHYVVMGYQLQVDLDLSGLPPEQHNQYAWFSREELLARDDVHKHSKWYIF